MRKYKTTLFKIVALLGASVLVLVLIELILRANGYASGCHTNAYYFNRVDSLYTKSGFTTDSSGIFKVDPTSAKEIERRIQNEQTKIQPDEANEVYSLVADNLDVLNGEMDQPLAQYYRELKSADSTVLTPLQKAIIHYVHDPINSEGFKSIPFKQYQNKKPSVLILGDSFAWGFSASNLYNSFADNLLAKGYTVYNTGMTATDVAQYLAVAKEYIPRLQPDYVIANFYIGNDITYYKRSTGPNKPVFYPTNAGNLMACPHGTYFQSPQEAHQFLIDQWYIPQNNLLNRLMAQTVITTQAWKVLNYVGLVNKSKKIQEYYQEVKQHKYDQPYSNRELRNIKNIAEQHGSEFILSSIPEVYSYKTSTTSDHPDLFGGLSYYEMPAQRANYNLDDAHFNDRGHRQYAAFLDSLIRHH